MPNVRNEQRAGDGSNQIQADIVNVYGIDESKVREIIRYENMNMINQMTSIAQETMMNRLNDYSNVLVPKLVKAELLDSFADPSIRVLFRKTINTAYCTDREKDYNLLSELLIHRIKKDGNYTRIAAINKAVEEINNISDEALLALTVIFCVLYYKPNSGNPVEGVQVLDNLFGLILKNNILPNNKEWIDNLEIVGAIRRVSYSKFKKIEDLYHSICKGYTRKGIKKDSQNYKKAIAILEDNNLGYPFVDNYFDNNYVRLNLFNIESFDSVCFVKKENDKMISINLSDQQKKALKDVVNLYDKEEIKVSEFKDFLMRYKNLKCIIEWWDNSFDDFFSLTAIGNVIAITNAKCIDSSLPGFDD